MSGKAVPSSGNTGPRDFSAEVHGNFASPVPAPAIVARIFLADEDAAKVAADDVHAALQEMLAGLGVQGMVEVGM